MHKSFICTFLLLATFSAFSQKPLRYSRRSSYYTYVYTVNEALVKSLYEGKKLDENALKSPIDSFLTQGKARPSLPLGNYLQVFAERNELRYSLIENRSTNLKLLDNRHDLQFILLDDKGDQITDAEVTINNKPIKYDPQRDSWHSKHPKKDNSLIRVRYNGFANYTKLTVEEEERKESNLSRWLLTKSFLKHPYKFFPRLFYKIKGESVPYKFRHYKKSKYKSPKTMAGYIVFNKPEYKPLDTVKFKAYLLKGKSHKPFSEKLGVRLINTSGNKLLGEIEPQHAGAYDFSFALHDSLKLKLDRDYVIELFKGDRVYKRGNFHYEEYELKSVSFTLRGDKKEHVKGQPQSLYFKATDENGLNVMDGRVKLHVLAESVSQFYKDNVFVPDTLWEHQIKLDLLGETKLVLPDSIFPDADIHYRVTARFLNSDNQEKHASAEFDYLTEADDDLHFEIKGDSLSISPKNTGSKLSAVKISAINANSDTVESFNRQLPAMVKINPYAEEYKVEGQKILDWFDLSEVKNHLDLWAQRSADSLFVKVDNPEKIPFWYTIIKAGEIIDGGQAITLNYRKPAGKSGKIKVQLNYFWADALQQKQLQVEFANKELHIDVKQPLAVSPGEKAELEISVTDAKGKAAKDVDLTAFSVTSKFKYNGPSVPYYGKHYKNIPANPEMETDEGISSTAPLNWQRWKKELGLDSIEYFKFTHPAPVYQHQELAPEGLTQIAPFVVEKGNVLPVEILYIDGKPVYFSNAQQLERYSFKADPGLVFIKFRFRNRIISANPVIVLKGKKLIISFNADTIGNKAITSISAPTQLSNYEASELNQYMIQVADTYSPRYAAINQPDKIYLLPANNYSWDRPSKLIGPLAYNTAEFALRGEKPVDFVAEPNYNYTFLPGLIKQKSIQGMYPFKTVLNSTSSHSYSDYVLTNNEADSLWLAYLDLRSNTTSLFDNAYVPPVNNGKLQIKIKPAEKQRTLPLIKNVLVYRYDNPDFLHIYPGNTTNLGYLYPGKHRLLILLKGDNYVLVENITIKANGRTFVQVALDKPLHKDSTSSKISSLILERSIALKGDISPNVDQIKATFNDHYLDESNFKDVMSGTVFDEKGRDALPGVTVKIKGSNRAVSTNAQGVFKIKVPKNGKLVFSYLGFETKEININHSSDNKIFLKENRHSLQEVVVVGYGTVQKEVLQQSLAGRVAGVQVGTVRHSSMASVVNIRGINSVPGKEPLVIIDGIPVDKGLQGLKPEDIAEMSTLKDAAATAIYGARAANGVVIITTKKAKEKALQEAAENPGRQGQSIRRNFSDYAFWQPRLRTDDQGKARFKVTFPDDITNWKTFFIGMGRKAQSGYAESSIKAFKPLSASFVAPAFAIAGDELSPIGKISNYTTTTELVNRNFAYNGKSIRNSNLPIKNSHIDTFTVIAESTDSLKFEYSIQKPNGYSDGEARTIPVFKAGIIETKGIFESLENDTAVNLSFDPKLGPVTLRAESSVLPVLLDETEHLRKYEYLCNEQLASKLKSLLAQKRIKNYLHEPFENDKTIKQLIKRLEDGRKSEGAWGWWKNTDAELWISKHAMEALLDAEKEGFNISLDKQRLTDHLIYQLSSYNGMNKLDAMLLLKRMDAKVDYKTPIALYEKELKSSRFNLGLYQKFKLIQLKQQVGGYTTDMDTLLKYRHSTMFGNMYFGNNSYHFFDNSIQLSLLAYQIIEADGKHPEWLNKLRNYFLEQRHDAYWRNTYESALILETLLPGLLKDNQKSTPVSLKINGAESINQFPYTTNYSAHEKLSIQKQGTFPVYLTAHQSYWNAQPEKAPKSFKVDSWFENKSGSKLNSLKGGEAVILKTEVLVNADADFVMVEIPIPAGCSYEEKERGWWGNEVHREYAKNKVNIFCRKLKEGNYTFSVKLMPRYGGTYSLNPAKAEMMYFPVFYGREAIKKVKIGN